MFRELMRKNKQLSQEACVQVLQQQTRGVLSVAGENGYPYGMPMNHWYDPEDGSLWFHCGKAGHRLDALKTCDKVCFCTWDEGEREAGEWAWNVKSVIVFGRMEIVDEAEKIGQIATSLSHKFTDDDAYIREEIRKYGKETLLLHLLPEHICGKLVKES